jgi:hypothetical protein
LPLLGIQDGPLQQFAHADEHVEWRADFVAHARQELALGLIGCFGLLLEQLNFFFRLFALGDVAGHGVDQLAEGGRIPQHPAVGAVLGAIPVLEQNGVLARDQFLHLGDGGRPVVRVHEIEEGRRGQILDPVSEHAFPGGIQALEVTIETRDAQ